ncbi:MBL fold metallo-hydrolase [Candidatus Pandoraea novymonadis]|uniref:Metallo-hydrolase n=1 Tax=Candidatus Pandoraea novymonadis TaxID=1808959 RepID=A0ABX5FFF4_9BURK|nr:MBL fold metallo-hydrolase [Candidatus Pandoraea novymonadis]PSB92453.1 putative metallo-hydrolase [Candidatus Pandoraea novymonadis]
MNVTLIPVTPFQQNCTVLCCNTTKRAAVIDPGGDIERIVSEIEHQGVALEKIFLTHGHLDHCGAAGKLAQYMSVPIEGPHIDDAFLINQLLTQSARFGFSKTQLFTPDRWLKDGDTVAFGNVTLDVLHCPGHTPGHIVFFSDNKRLASVGDVLFAGSIGRTDFPKSNYVDLIKSIRTKLWPLGDDVTFIPGHGPMSTFGQERQTNPYVADTVLTSNDSSMAVQKIISQHSY